MDDTNKVIEQIKVRCSRARKFRYQLGKKMGTDVQDGTYVMQLGCQHLTVLEAVVLGEPYTGDIIQDAANVLGTSRDFVEGLNAGLSLRKSHS